MFPVLLLFTLHLAASDNKDFGEYFQLLPREILNTVITAYLDKYDIPSMAICVTNQSWYYHEYQNHTPNTIQDYGIKQKVFFDTSKWLYEIPWATFIKITDCNSLSAERTAKIIDRKFSDKVQEIAKKHYETFFDFCENLLKKNSDSFAHNTQNINLILYDRKQNTYEYSCDLPDMIDTILSSSENKKKIIKLIHPGIKYTDYYNQLYSNRVSVTNCIYTEKNHSGEKFLTRFIKNISRAALVSHKDSNNVLHDLIELVCKILHYDIESGHNIIVSHFLNDLNTFCETYYRSTILEVIIKKQNYRAIETLLLYGINPNKYGSSTLCRAIIKGNIAIVHLLLQYGTNPNTLNKNDVSPLSLATLCKWQAIVKTLLEIGAHPDGIQGQKNTPLYQAAFNGDLNMARLLIQGGANVNKQQKDGSTPLHLATHRENRYDFAELLLQHGADPLISDNTSKTPLDYAREKGFTETVLLLENYLQNKK